MEKYKFPRNFLEIIICNRNSKNKVLSVVQSDSLRGEKTFFRPDGKGITEWPAITVAHVMCVACDVFQGWRNRGATATPDFQS